MISVRRFVLFLGLWLALTSGARDGWIIGLLAAALATLLGNRLLPPADRSVRLVSLIALLPGFLWRSILAGVDVAWQAVRPHPRLRPGWIEYPTRLRGGARVMLGSEISLMPGTLAAGSDGDRLYVHCLDREGPVEAQVAAEEGRIGASIGLARPPERNDG